MRLFITKLIQPLVFVHYAGAAIAPAITASMISAGAGLAAGGLTGGLALTSNRKNREWAMKQYFDAKEENRKIREEAYQHDLEQWERENAYNSPSAQMQRYADAGLNPNLIYGQQNLSASSPKAPVNSVSPAQLPSQQPVGDFGIQQAAQNFINTYTSIKAMQFQENQNKIQTEIGQQQINLLKERVKAEAEKNIWNSQLRPYQLSKMNFDQKKWLNDWMMYDVKNEQERTKLGLMRLQLKYHPQLFEEQINGLKAKNSILDYDAYKAQSYKWRAQQTGIFPDDLRGGLLNSVGNLANGLMAFIKGNDLVQSAKNLIMEMPKNVRNKYNSIFGNFDAAISLGLQRAWDNLTSKSTIQSVADSGVD